MNNKLETNGMSSDVKISPKFFESLKKLLVIEEKQEYVLGIDFGNGISKQMKGTLKPDFRKLYKRKKKGKKYKFFKTKSIHISEFIFVGTEVI